MLEVKIVICRGRNRVFFFLIFVALVFSSCEGPPGPPGAPGVSGYEVVVSERFVETWPFGNRETLGTDCPQGKVVLGGGGHVEHRDVSNPRAFPFMIRESFPRSGGGGWEMTFENTFPGSVAGVNVTIVVYAICANVSP